MGKTASESSSEGGDGAVHPRLSDNASSGERTRASALVFARVELNLVSTSRLGDLVLYSGLCLVELLLGLSLKFYKCRTSAVPQYATESMY